MGSFASERLHGIATRLRAEGQRGMQRKLSATLRGAAAPLVTAVRAEAMQRLPKSGGLNVEQASQPIRVSVLTGSRGAGVRIRTKTPGSVQTNSGYVRHPTFGRRGRGDWQDQPVPAAAGWWSDTLAAGSAEVTTLILFEMERVARIIEGGY